MFSKGDTVYHRALGRCEFVHAMADGLYKVTRGDGEVLFVAADDVCRPDQTWAQREAELSSRASDDGLTVAQSAIKQVCHEMAEFLVEKNRSYGNSALEPVRIMSKSDAIEQLKVRIDDKLARIVRGHELVGDDTVKDLCGYLILLMVAGRLGK